MLIFVTSLQLEVSFCFLDLVRHCEEGNFESTKTETQVVQQYHISILVKRGELPQMIGQLRKCVRRAISYLDDIIVVVRLKQKRQSVKLVLLFPLSPEKGLARLWSLFRILNVLPLLQPAFLGVLLPPLWKNIGLHASGVEWFGFLKVAEVDLVNLVSLQVDHLKIIPVQVAPRIGINPHKTVELVLVYLYRRKNTLKTASRFPDSNCDSNLTSFWG